MIGLNLFMQHPDDRNNTYNIDVIRDKEGDLRIDLMRLVDGWRSENASVYLRPDLACKLRDRLNVLFPHPEPELIKLREPEASEVTK